MRLSFLALHALLHEAAFGNEVRLRPNEGKEGIEPLGAWNMVE